MSTRIRSLSGALGAAAVVLAATVPVAAAADPAPGTVTTFAGDGKTLADGPPSARLRIHAPRGVAVDRAGNRYYSENDPADRVMKVDTTGTLSELCNSCGGLGLAVDRAGNVYSASRVYVRKITPAGGVEIIAGTGNEGFSGDGGPATSARIKDPWGVAVDDAGNVYIADTGNNRVRKITAGTINTVAPFDRLGSVAADRDGNVFVAAGNQVHRLTGAGAVSVVAGTGDAGFSGDGGPATAAKLNTATAVAVDDAGNLFVADSGNRRIRRIDLFNQVISTVAGNGNTGYGGDGGPATSATFGAGLYGIAVDPTGRTLFVGDHDNYRLRQVTNNTISTLAGTGVNGGDVSGPANTPINGPRAVTFDRAGNFYIADTAHNLVRKVTPAGALTTVAGTGAEGSSGDGGPAISARLTRPAGVAVDGAGSLYISTKDNRIRKVTAAGVIQTIAGDGTAGFTGDNGPASAARLNDPAGLAVDGAGNLLVADSGNDRIRQIDTTGQITTVAGNGSLGSSGDGGSAIHATVQKPSAVAADGSGNFYIAETGFHKVRKVYSYGTIVTIAGDGTAGFSGDRGSGFTAQLSSPTGVTVDGNGIVYIADAGNNRVRQLDTAGKLHTVVGTGTAGFSGDNGPGTSAQVNGVSGLAADASGNVYLADATNNRVRKLLAPTPFPPGPTARIDSVDMKRGQKVSGNVLTNDSGDGITVISGGPAHSGKVGVAPNGAFTYTPAGPWITQDWFVYTIRDVHGDMASATVYLGEAS